MGLCELGAVDLGFALPVAGAWATPENQLTVARRAEERGYASLWVFQRLLYALAPQNRYPYSPAEQWPAPFERVADPIVTLSYVAAATERIRLGLAVVNALFYAPVVLAKQLATLDVVSGGRLDVGVGLGWSKDEYEAAGVPYEDRAARLEELLHVLRLLWTEDIVEHHGRYYTIPRARFEPKPRQVPHPPLLLGGYVPATIARVARLGDGLVTGNVPFERAKTLVAGVRDAASAAGRDPDSLRIVARGSVVVDPPPTTEERRPLWGTLEEIREDIARYDDAGVTELFLELNFDPTIGGRHSDPEASMARAMSLLDALSPKG